MDNYFPQPCVRTKADYVSHTSLGVISMYITMNLPHLKHPVFEVGVSYYIVHMPSTKPMGGIDFLCESTQKYSQTTSVGNSESFHWAGTSLLLLFATYASRRYFVVCSGTANGLISP